MLERGSRTAVHVAGALSSSAYAVAAWKGDSLTLAGFAALWALALAILLALVLAATRGRARLPLAACLGWALAFRAIGVAGEPLLEDDYYRYLWDGRTVSEGGSPYASPPSTSFGDELPPRFEEILDRVSYPDVATVYGPLCQFVFAAGFAIAPGETWPLQAFFAFCDFALALLLARRVRPVWLLALAWNPLAIKEFAFTAHPDALGVALAFGACLACAAGRWPLGAAALALAASAKVFALALAPLVLLLNLRAWLFFAGTLALVTLPFLPENPWAPAGLHAMAAGWRFNAPLFEGFAQAGFAEFASGALRALAGAVFSLVVAVWSLHRWRARDASIPDGAALFGALLALSPVVNPWYVAWLLPFAALQRRRWPFVAAACSLASYGHGGLAWQDSLAPYQVHPVLLFASWALTLVAFACERAHVRRSE